MSPPPPGSADPSTSRRPRRRTPVARASRLEIHLAVDEVDRRVLSPGALLFLGELVDRFGPSIAEALEARRRSRTAIRSGTRPELDAGPPHVRDPSWRVPPAPPDLQDRRVELRGPADPASLRAGLAAGASVYVADLEACTAPGWRSILGAHRALLDEAAGVDRGTARRRSTLLVRPRPWHVLEDRTSLGDRAVPAALFDAGLHVYHAARRLLDRGSGPYLQLPKVHSGFEARLWDRILRFMESSCGLPTGSIRVSVPLDTVSAVFAAEEILWELRERSIGASAAPWDYVADHVRVFEHDPTFLLPDRERISGEQIFLWAYVRRLVDVSHRRGAHAIGPVSTASVLDAAAEDRQPALERLLHEKAREAHDGFDGTTVADAALAPLVRDLLDLYMSPPHQIHRRRPGVRITAWDLIEPPIGPRTEAGLAALVRSWIAHAESRLLGSRCRLEDGSGACLPRSILRQWLRHRALLTSGRPVDPVLVDRIAGREILRLRDAGRAGAESLSAIRGVFRQWIRGLGRAEGPLRAAGR